MIIFILRLSRSVERSKRYFHGRGRKGKRQVQRRFLRKHGAAGKLLLSASGLNPLSHRCAMPAPPKGELFEVAVKFLIVPNTLATGFKPWLPLRGSWRGSA